MDDRDKKIADMNAEQERLRRRIAVLESRAAGDGLPDKDLRETLLRLNAILNNIPDIAWLKDRESRFIAVNEPFGEACGFSPADLAGKTDLDIWPRELAESYRADDAEVMRSGKRKRVEELLVGPDGKESWIETIKTPILDAQGRLIGTTGIARDITGRKQAETKIRNVTRLYSFLGQINQAIVRTRDRDELFRTICRVAIEFGQFRMAWVGLVDDAGVVRPMTHAGHEDGYLSTLTVRLGDTASGKGPTGSALREGALNICDDIATDPRMQPWRDNALKCGYRSSAAIPFRLRGAVMGTLNLYASERGFFTDDERKLLTEIGADISFALDTMESEKERTRAEESLYLKNHVFDVSIAANSIADTHGIIMQVNQAFLAVWGYSSKEEVIGRQIREFLQNADEAAAITAALNTAGKWEGNYTARKKDGSLFSAFGLATILKDEQGALIGYQSSVLDVTQRKRAEEALRESEERYRTLFETMAQGVVYQDQDGRIISANPAAERILGVSIDQMQGRTSMDPRWRTIHEDGSDFPGDQHPAMEALRTGKPVRDTIMGVFHPGRNEYRWILVNAVPEFLPGETRPFQVYATFIDLTERRKAEEALVKAKEFAEKLIDTANSVVVVLDAGGNITVFNRAAEEITGYRRSDLEGRNWFEVIVPKDRYPEVWAEFERLREGGLPRIFENPILTRSGEERHIVWQNKELLENGRVAGTISFGIDITDRKRAEKERLELERRLLHAQKLESLGILAGGIAHDFNNLLMAVLGNLDLALRKLSPVSPARLNIEHSAQAASRAADLTRQMLAYSGRGSFIIKPLDLSELVAENAHLFRSSVARTTELNVRLARPLPAVEADAGQVQQVIMNLITNASEAIGEKTGVITLTTGVQDCDRQCLKRSRIEDVPDAGRFVFLEVSDNGCGMDEQTQQRLFDPFFTTKARGRGLGMSAILGIVRGHQGAIFVESTPGTGTTIRVLFPASQRPLAVNDGPSGADAREAADPMIGGTVLVVDDEEIVRNVCREMVKAFGLQVLTAVDGRDAIEVFTKHAEDVGLVILDLSMPNMDGMAAFKELARIKPGVKVLLCSGFDEQDSLQHFSGQGLAGFIQKPYSLKNLREALVKAGFANE